MKTKRPLKPASTRTTGRQAPRMAREEALKLGRLSREERKARRRKLQIRHAAQRQRDRKRAEKLKLQLKAPVWKLPDPPPASEHPAGVDYGSRIPADPEEPIRKTSRRKRAPYVRRAVRAEPTRETQGPWREGESARSWGEGKGGTRVPVDVSDFLREVF